MKKLLVLLVVTIAIVATVTTGILMAESPGDDDWMVGLPAQNDDGSWDPPYFPVSNEFGVRVGVHRTGDSFGGADVYPIPVYNQKDTSIQIGWLGEHGYWAIGEQSPWCADCVETVESVLDGKVVHRVTDTYNEDRTITRTTEQIDDDGNVTTTVETITEGAR